MNLRLMFSALVAGVVVASLVTSPTMASSMGPGGGGAAAEPSCELAGGADCAMIGQMRGYARTALLDPSTTAYAFNGSTGTGLGQDTWSWGADSFVLRSGASENIVGLNTGVVRSGNAASWWLGTGATLGAPHFAAAGNSQLGVYLTGDEIALVHNNSRNLTATSDRTYVVNGMVLSTGPTYVSTNPSGAPTCDSSRRGMLLYREDTDTAGTPPALCFCSRDNAALSYTWKLISGTGGC